MSGKGSRQRRVEASRAAKTDVYASRGSAMVRNPFEDPRQRRIYEMSYAHWHALYWRMESRLAEMREVYGYVRYEREGPK